MAPRLTTAQLRARLRRALLAIDPDWARRRYRQSVRSRCVTAVLDCDGTVTMTAYSLPAEEASAACARVDRLADATKRAGHRSRVGQIAADVFLGLLDGRFHRLTEDQIVAALLRDPRPEDTPTNEASATNNPAGGSAAGGVPGAAGEAPAAGASAAKSEDGPAEAEDTGGEGENGGDDAGDDAGTDSGTDSDTDSDTDAGTGGAVAGIGAGAEASTDSADQDGAGHVLDNRGPVGGVVPTGIEVRVGLATLLGLDERPAEIAGLGPVLADVARRVAARQLRGAEWRFAVTDSDGYLVLGGITRQRPTTIPGTTGIGRSRGGVVELQVSADELDRLAAAAATGSLPLGWAGLVADIVAQFAGRDTLPGRPRQEAGRSVPEHGVGPPCPDPGQDVFASVLPAPRAALRARPHH